MKFIDYIRSIQKKYHAPKLSGVPHFTGGLVGYMGYESIAWVEDIPIYEKDFKIKDVHSADEIFVTGTFAGIIPAIEVDGYKISNGNRGKLTSRLQEYYSNKLSTLYPKV